MGTDLIEKFKKIDILLDSYETHLSGGFHVY